MHVRTPKSNTLHCITAPPSKLDFINFCGVFKFTPERGADSAILPIRGQETAALWLANHTHAQNSLKTELDSGNTRYT